ncbi:MAG: hypothetical protein ACK4Q5_05450 [Saprospiraceae bacterium]
MLTQNRGTKMPYFREGKEDAAAATKIHKNLLAGKKPAHNDPELPKTFDESIALEGQVFQDLSGEVKGLLGKKGNQVEVAKRMSEASAIVASIDKIAHARAEKSKTKT